MSVGASLSGVDATRCFILHLKYSTEEPCFVQTSRDKLLYVYQGFSSQNNKCIIFILST